MAKSKQKAHKLRVPVRSSLSFFAFLSVSKASAFLTTPIFTRLLTPEEYALTPLYYTWLSVFTTLSTLELTGSILLSGLARHKEERDRYLSAATSLTLTPYFLTLLVYLLFRERVNALTGLSSPLILLMFLQIGSSIITASVEASAKFFYTPKRALPTVLSSAILSPVLGFLLVRSGVLRAQGRIVAAAVSSALVAIPCFFQLYRRSHAFFDKTIWREQISRALPLFPHYLALMSLGQAGRVFVSRMDTPDALAKLGVASTLSHAIPLLASAINSAFYPWLLRRVAKGEMTRVREVTSTVVYAITLAAMCLILIAPEFYAVLAPTDGYGDGLYATPPLILGSILAFLYTVVAGVNLERVRTYRVALTTLGCAAIGVALMIPAVKAFGFVGGALATAISYGILFLAHARLLRRQLGAEGSVPLSIPKALATVLLLLPATLAMLSLKSLLSVRLLLLFVPLLLLLELALRSRSLLRD